MHERRPVDCAPEQLVGVEANALGASQVGDERRPGSGSYQRGHEFCGQSCVDETCLPAVEGVGLGEVLLDGGIRRA